jgi:hypothetical protein
MFEAGRGHMKLSEETKKEIQQNNREIALIAGELVYKLSEKGNNWEACYLELLRCFPVSS